MTLFKQIMIFITALLGVALVVVFGINFRVSKNFVQNDLYQQAKNSVNSLSLSLSKVSDDVFMMETTINAMFDGGHFQRITLKSADNKLVYEKEENLVIQGVPDLFIRFLHLEAPIAEAVVSNGWNIVGTLEVQGYTGPACLRMWEIFKRLSISFSGLWLACTLFSSFMLNLLLKSLDRIREQAEAIEQNRFIINSSMPTTVELRKVVIQMNKMVETVQRNYTRSIETIKEAKLLQFRDRVSGLYNKPYFVRSLSGNLASQEAISRGETVLVAVDGLGKLKESDGYAASEAFIKAVAELLENTTRQVDDRVIAVLKEEEFALILPRMGPEEATKISGLILEGLRQRIHSEPPLAKFLRVFSGLASYTYEDTATSVFSKLDYAMVMAKNSKDPVPVHFEEKRDAVFSRQEWKSLIETAMTEKLFGFCCQSVLSRDNIVLHNEVFINLRQEDGVKRAGYFMPMAMELGLARRIDQYVLTWVAEILEKEPQKAFSVNISADFILSRTSLIWARQFFASHKALTPFLTCEISEETLVRNQELCLDFAGLLRGMGFSLGIDNFTIHETALSLLQELSPAYIKVDHALLHGLGTQEASKITLSLLQTIVESLDIKLIGTRIKTQAQVEAMKAAGIHFFQGIQVADIQPLERHD